MNAERFKELFVWDQDKIEDVRFWCEPELTSQAIHEIQEHFDMRQIDGFVAIEARGFYLAGIASAIYKKPCVMVRKHKEFYDKMDHESIHFKNWKGEPDSLTILRDTLPRTKSVLIVDDILDTGSSIRATQELLSRLNTQVEGAFYLLNSYGGTASQDFGVPIESLLVKKLFC